MEGLSYINTFIRVRYIEADDNSLDLPFLRLYAAKKEIKASTAQRNSYD